MRAVLPRALAVVVWLNGCTIPPDPAGEPGTPLPGLLAADLERFQRGLVEFDRIYRPEDGAGPFLNENQCSACHTQPAQGGTGEQAVVKDARFEAPGRCDLLEAENGANVHIKTSPALRALGVERRPAPTGGTEHGLFRVPFLFGLGLVEAVPESEILALADPEDRDGDGISGRPGRDASGRFARFGRKADNATISDFTAGALLMEMGITSPAHPTETPLPPGIDAAAVDPAPDPEVGADVVALLSDFVRFLAPIGRRAPADAEERDWVERGERLFGETGCTDCHVPDMTTGRTPNPALDRKTVRLYSDLLLHDLGPGLASVCAPGSTPDEHRTELLMGLRFRDRYLHDGRTRDLIDAVLRHGGEAQRSKDAFATLDRLRQEAVVRFLKTL
jgi:CxxC motif-containing protein (DUF1111 family)